MVTIPPRSPKEANLGLQSLKFLVTYSFDNGDGFYSRHEGLLGQIKAWSIESLLEYRPLHQNQLIMQSEKINNRAESLKSKSERDQN